MDDLIPRAAAVRALASSNGDYLDALERLEKIPAVDAVPVTWLKAHSREYCEDWGEEPVTVENALTMWQKEQEAR